MALKPIMDGKKIIGYEEEPDPDPFEWKEWGDRGDYDGSDGEFVSGKSHVGIDRHGHVARISGKGWGGIVMKYRRYGLAGDEELGTM